MNEFNGGRGAFNAMYYWDQFQPIIAAVAILLLGWIIALIVAAAVSKGLNALRTNERISSATNQAFNLEKLIARVIFWIILIIAVIGAFNVLNLTSVSGPFSVMIQQFLIFIPQLLAAAAVGVIGWIIASLVKAGLQNVLNRTQLDEKLSAQAGVSPISQNISDIVYWLILLLFLPIVLSILGLYGLLAPIQSMLNEVISYLPNLFMAVVVVFAGYILAKIVRGIVQGLLSSLNVEAQAQKIGVFKNTKVTQVLASFSFAVVMITAIIIAFETLGIAAISEPATGMLHDVMAAIPNIIAAGLILVIAYVVSRFVAQLVADVLAGTGIDEVPQKFDAQRFLGTVKVSNAVAYLLVFFTMLFAVSEAANRLGFTQVNELIAMFIHFAANIVLGAVILVIGFWLANVVASVVQRGQEQRSKWLANLIRILIMGLVIAMGLRAMGIADSIVNLAFGLTLGAVAVAFALAFGLGGRQPAEKLLNQMIDQCKKEHCTGERSTVPTSAPSTAEQKVTPTSTSSVVNAQASSVTNSAEVPLIPKSDLGDQDPT